MYNLDKETNFRLKAELDRLDDLYEDVDTSLLNEEMIDDLIKTYGSPMVELNKRKNR